MCTHMFQALLDARPAQLLAVSLAELLHSQRCIDPLRVYLRLGAVETPIQQTRRLFTDKRTIPLHTLDQ